MTAKSLLIASVLLSCSFSASAAPAPSYQQGPKLVGAGAVGAAGQGLSVSLSANGNTAVVGGYADNGSAGATWVYARSAGAWSQQGAKLVGTGAVGAGRQGWSARLSSDGNTAVVGGYLDNIGAGAAWVYTRSAGVWSQQGAKLVGTGAVGPANQGFSVALSADGNTAVVGAPADNVSAGAAWVYTRSGGVWSQQGVKLVGTGAVGPANQGFSVALSADGNTAVVGGNQDNSNAGAAWVYTRSAGVWSQQGAKLVGTGAVGAARQGWSIALSADGNTAVVGGSGDNGNAGAAWVYTRSAGVWSQQGAKLIGTGAVGAAEQGWSVALSADGNTALVGGNGDNSAGAAWVYTRDGGVWGQQGAKRVGTGAAGAAQQGYSVALSADGYTALVGGIDDNNSVGAAWVFIDPAPKIATIVDIANDQGRQVRVSFISSLFDRLGSGTPITGYHIYRREAVALTLRSWAVPRVAPDAAAAPSQVELAGWDYVMTVPATTDSAYQTVVSTLADSNTTGIHRAALFVRAATATPGIYFDSAPDSGYSADNLPPAPPAPFTGAYAGGATNLHWGVNSEPDFWYYKLYRGSSAGFVPGAGNQIASKSDTGFVDVGPAGGYYKLSAVDVNGNESVFALLAPGSTLGVGEGGLPHALALAAPLPNPASEQTMLSFALSEAGLVQLAVYDMEGRRVRTVTAGRMEAGGHQVRFDLRDGRGRQISSGIYFVRLEAYGRTLMRRLAVLE